MFSQATVEAIKSYVYALVDDENRIFYIGKGEGNRVFNHVDEVRRLLLNNNQLDEVSAAEDQDDSIDSSSPKHQRIASLLKKGFDPIKYIIREGLTPEQALLIEATLISVLDWQLQGGLTNQVSGHGTYHFGLKTVEELEATKGAPFQLDKLPGLKRLDQIVAINVNRRWPEVVARKSTLLEISKGCWKLSLSRAQECKYAIIHANGIVRGVFEIKKWCGPDKDGRLTFEPVCMEPMSGPGLSQVNASSLFGNSSGSQNPIRYIRY